jgi:transposase
VNDGVEEIPDADHELVIARVCAIDVAKASGKVCVRVPHPKLAGRRVSRVWDVVATSAAVAELAGQLVEQRVERVTVESTSDYWRIWFYLLEAAGLQVQLVNARDVKNVPGRPKTDKLDAVWLAKLTEKGMLRPSFVPPAQIRQLRDYTRLRIDLTRERTRHWQRMEKLLEDALIKVSSVVSSLDSMSVRDMLEALIAGERDPRRLADLARGKMRPKRAALIEALSGRFDAHHGVLARVLLDQIDALNGQITVLTEGIEELLAEITNPPTDSGEDPANMASTAATAVQRLSEVTGIGQLTAQVIVAEIGIDMTRFPTAAHLVSWARLSPRTVQSGAVLHGGRTGKGNPYLKGVLGEAAAVAARTDSFLGERYRRLVKRRGKLKALVAVARSILVIVWNLLADPSSRYHDLGSGHYISRTDTQRRVRNHLSQLAALGYRVTVEPDETAA